MTREFQDAVEASVVTENIIDAPKLQYAEKTVESITVAPSDLIK